MEADSYRLKGLLRESIENGGDEDVASALSDASACLLDPLAWSRYDAIDPSHAMLERFVAETIGRGWWRFLWIPPSMPYYALGGPFGEVPAGSVTKRLVFSAWHVVPRALSILLSYEAERRMRTAFDSDAVNTPDDLGPRRLLNFTRRPDGRLTGMPVFAWLYPSPALADLTDPLERRGAAERADLADVLREAESQIEAALAPLVRKARSDGPEDQSWYWAAPILLDRVADSEQTAAWFAQGEEAFTWGTTPGDTEGWQEHVRQAADVATGRQVPLGKLPADLCAVLALLGVAGPGNCALRALARGYGDPALRWDDQVRRGAGRIAWGFRTLFNAPEVIALVRSLKDEEPYWQRVLEYAAAGCLQSVLDEYVHMLVELAGPTRRPLSERVMELAKGIAGRVGLRAATPGMDWVDLDEDGAIRIQPQRVRARFAMRFGDERGERDEGTLRKDAVRAAFNSPFWPFLLVTTSIGQEGLDFHTYCHAVLHWNPPRNPVDMEQREGRVHRYKGHAIRKNVAQFAEERGLVVSADSDPWQQLFDAVIEEEEGDGGIRPFWVFEGRAAIERHTPSLPLSREAALLPRLRASLAVYRMVFGQPRQVDLIEHLRRTVPEAELARHAEELRIDLEPAPEAGS